CESAGQPAPEAWWYRPSWRPTGHRRPCLSFYRLARTPCRAVHRPPNPPSSGRRQKCPCQSQKQIHQWLLLRVQEEQESPRRTDWYLRDIRSRMTPALWSAVRCDWLHTPALQPDALVPGRAAAPPTRGHFAAPLGSWLNSDPQALPVA